MRRDGALKRGACMARKLVVAISELTDAQRQAIARDAAARGFAALFFDDVEAALPALADAEVVFGQDARLAQNAPKLRWLCSPFAGVDNLLAPGVFASPDALLSNSSGAYGVTIAEHIIMVALIMLRRQLDYAAIAARRGWQRGLAVRSIYASRVTLLGTGDIGRETALRLRAFSPSRLTGVNRGGRDESGLFDRVLPREALEEVLPETDILILSLPGTKETRGLLDKAKLALLPDGALLINVGRGSALNEAALERELRAGRLRAALDVFEHEPLPEDSPLWGCPNLLITPHVAGNMTLPQTVERIVALFLEDFANYCEGRPLKRLVEREKGY